MNHPPQTNPLAPFAAGWYQVRLASGATGMIETYPGLLSWIERAEARVRGETTARVASYDIHPFAGGQPRISERWEVTFRPGQPASWRVIRPDAAGHPEAKKPKNPWKPWSF